MEQQKKIDAAIASFEKKVVAAHKTLINQLTKAIDISNDLIIPRKSFDSQMELELRFLEQCLLEHPDALPSFLKEVVPHRTANAAKWSPMYLPAVEKWAERYPLLFPWASVFLDCIAVNVNNGMEVEEALATSGAVKFSSKEEDTTFTFSNDGYSLATDGLRQASDAFAKAVATALADNAKKQVEIFKVQGFTSPPPIRNRESDLVIRLRWLAQHLFLGWSLDTILADHKKRTGHKFDKTNLSKRLREFADQLGLPIPETQKDGHP